MFHSHEFRSNSLLNVSMDSQEQSFNDIQIEPSCESLLTVLDDKNKIIDTLKRQLQNQKVQLAYYLKKELTPKKMAKLSKSCSPVALEENMAVKLAMINFNQQMGIKSNIMTLYERMCYIDERITSSLDDQEFILRKIVNKLCELVKHANGTGEFRVKFSRFIMDPFHIELFNKLLNATVNLRKKLDTFRICCNRLMIIEDERNAIVEQIYSLPVDQRMNCNYLVSIQTEKVQLENELQQIIKDQRRDQERIKELNVIEEKLSNLQFQLNSTIFENDGRMLQRVNSEARILLQLTKHQRKKFETQLSQIRETNLSLERILVYLKLALENRELSPIELIEYGITTEEDHKIFECIRKEIYSSKMKFRCKMFDELQTKIREIELMKNKLSQAMLEKNELNISNGQLKRNISDMKFNQELDLSSLKEERDMYKKQVDDLEAIREAYAQLVHKQPTANNEEREYLEQIKDRDARIYDLEKINNNLTKDLQAMKNTVNKQNREINQQIMIMQDLKQYNRNEPEDKHLKYVYKNTNTEMHSSFKDIRDLHEYHDTISYVELYQQEIYVQEKMINWVEDSGDYSLQRSHKPTAFTSRRLGRNYDGNSKENQDIKESRKSVTCIKVLSSKKAQSTDVIETTVTTRVEEDSQGNIRRSNSSDFFLEINSKPNTATRNTVEGEKSEVDENELMRDCSAESIPRICHSRKRFKETCFQQRFPVINDNMEY